jgi:hypothetical protein
MTLHRPLLKKDPGMYSGWVFRRDEHIRKRGAQAASLRPPATGPGG